MQTIFWHDYETFGADPQRDRPCQFAGIRTDTDLNIVGKPITLYCKPSDDMLPVPEACFITGITPQIADEYGVSEADFIHQIHEEMSLPGTCVAGYNSIRFDDEVTRNTLYRNFYDPYAREWQNGNSRWDIIDMVRLTYALRPEGINWPLKDDGSPSFRLEDLTVANGIQHEAAHDAMSDVYATIAIAKLIKEKQPKLYDYVYAHRAKQKIAPLLDTNTMKPVFHVSSRFPASIGCSSLVAPIATHPTNSNGVIVYDLRFDPFELESLSVQDIKNRIFTRASDLPEGVSRIPLKTVHVNKCPVIAPATMLKSLSVEGLERLHLNGDTLRNNLKTLRSIKGLKEKLTEVFSQSDFEKHTDPDLMIYSGGFFSSNDKATMDRVRQSSVVELAEDEFNFEDPRLSEMLFRYKARNYRETLTSEEQEQWERYRYQRLTDSKLTSINFQQYFDQLKALAQAPNTSVEKLSIIEDLKYYGESIIPYL
ncbi:exodeoxyribonuclease I [Alkalimarinus alittae]|uniref:Exodeoxyribonuclease I n=1 Tax=Alkalimarinus alittae TaxID=2961619 RepID=A0ABY6MYQ8_9ALTE|nr:exodeoxyribonuclease I [Alkalimarinus alittae]UZE94897.1 exodeoxyribonuclease I [Alkalimarinus alittae]